VTKQAGIPQRRKMNITTNNRKQTKTFFTTRTVEIIDHKDIPNPKGSRVQLINKGNTSINLYNVHTLKLVQWNQSRKASMKAETKTNQNTGNYAQINRETKTHTFSQAIKRKRKK
jgi:outer membrane cobalamin receptor